MKRELGKYFLCLICLLFVFQLPIHVSAKETRPWQDEIVYSIMIDRFNNGDSNNDKGVDTNHLEAYQGGDVQGIIKRLDYIKEMGFTAILLSPPTASSIYDGYDPTDITKMNEHFGQVKDMQQLVQEAHKRDMKVMFEFVVDHKDEAGTIEYAKRWIRETNIDGYHLVHNETITKTFLSEVIAAVQSVKRDFFIITDTQMEGVKGVWNQAYQERITDVFTKPNLSIKPLYDVTKSGGASLEGTFVDNSQTERFVRKAKENKCFPPTRLKLALTYLYTSPGIPFVYYGTEIALDGGKVPDNRRLMDFKSDEKFLQYIEKLGDLRKTLPSLRYGTFELLYDKDGMSVIKRKYKDETTFIAMNNTTEIKKVELAANEFGKDHELRGLLEGDRVREENGKYYIVLKRETANVYALAGKSGWNWSFIAALVGVNVLFIIFLVLVKKRKGTKSY
ncbi:alpha-amylase family glycosyl hydrolase [Bacillus cytotoxicus]|uniref:Alpha-amylase family glycosyl hydrolase n=1 Tax=Bacillus cytotoxicus TaxID=580165 RepID=A0ACC6A356_9BACI|nr:alpha-amylase family glycosyl hydrolase [Bacillus cytotoxicus]